MEIKRLKIKATITHIATRLRIMPILYAFTRYGHAFIPDEQNDADLWLVDCMQPEKISTQTLENLSSFKGQIIFISLGDFSSFKMTLPDEILDKACGFAKIQWEKDISVYNRRILGKQICMPPFLIDGLNYPEKNKSNTVLFYGLPTGDIDANKNLRIQACRQLKNKLWFQGGIVGQEQGTERDISEVQIPIHSRKSYLKLMNNSLISLCLPGNSVLTYRHFETIGMQSCMLTCCIDQFKWLNKMIPGYHYIAVKPDLCDIVEICEKLLENKKNTLQIAENGHKIYDTYYRIMPDGGITEAMWFDIKEQFRRLGVMI